MGVLLPFTDSPGAYFSDNPPGTPLIGYHNIVIPTNIAASTEADGFPVTNMANPATHLFWKGTYITGGNYIDITTAGEITDYVAIAGHNLGSIGTFVFLTDVGVSPFISITTAQLLTDDSPIIIRYPPASYSQIRISFTDTVGVPQIAVIYAGRLLVLERGIKVDVTHTPITYGRKTNIINGMSESGNFLGRIVLSESRKSKAEFFAFTPTFYRNSIDPFLISAQEFPFFWAWAPSDYPLETGYAWLTEDAVPEISPDHRRIALTLNMAGLS